MWIKQVKKQNSAQGKVFYQYQLTRSCRIEGKVKHIAVLYLGSHPLLASKTNRKILARLLKERISGAVDLEKGPEVLEGLADDYYEKYLIKNPDRSISPPSGQLIYEAIHLASTTATDSKEIGCEWMMRQMADHLGVEAALRERGFSAEQVALALISLISRAIAVASEHKTAQWLAHNSGLTELFDLDGFMPTRHHLYAAASRLSKHKDFLEHRLYTHTLNLFGLPDQVVIYDLTNTYFEGRKAGSELARFGKSKEKRNDCKQVVLAAVVNGYGMLRYSRIYAGNMSDAQTLEEVLDSLQQKTDKKGPLVIDAGIATEENLAMLRKRKQAYLCVSRTKLKDYQTLVETDTVEIRDKRKGKITLKVVKAEGRPDTWMYVRSEGKAIKEQSMDQQACQRFEQELKTVQEGIHKKGGTKKYGKVMERIGRIKERYPRAHSHYQLTIRHDKKNIATALEWEQKKPEEKFNSPTHGVYFLRTNLPLADEKLIWSIYNTIREVEASFRTLKTDLNLRPIFHQKDEYTQAHLHLGLLAYQLVAAIRYQLREKGLHYDWRNIVRIMNTQKLITLQQEAKTKTLQLRMATKPIREVEDIYNALGFKHYPFKTKKFVVYH